MKKRTVWIIVSLMSIALIGLIGFQVFWINNAIRLSNERFDKDVQESLSLVVERLEKKDALDHTIQKIKVTPQNGFRFEADTTSNGTHTYYSKDYTTTVEVKVDSDNDGKVFISRNEKTIHKDSLDKRVKSKTELMSWVMDGIVDHESRDNRITIEIIDSLLNSELNNKGIHTSYEFAVFDRDQDSVVISSTDNTSPLVESVHTANLFPNDIISNANYLSVNFPEKSQYLFRDIWTTLLTSVLFTAIIIGCFVYALVFIAKQKKLAEMKNDFINNMTHEFKTPLATVSLAADTIRELQSGDTTTNRYLGIIKDETLSLERQVERILDIASMEKHSVTLYKEKTDLIPLTNEVINKMQIRFHESSGECTFNHPSEACYAEIDIEHFSNAITNIMDNALKYNERNPVVDISLNKDPEGYQLSVTDNGVGMTQKEIKNIFDKFYRVQSGNIYHAKGFGLGLSYTSEIINAHGGSITVNSTPGKGSSFKIVIPS